jgi:hypothetical protein
MFTTLEWRVFPKRKPRMFSDARTPPRRVHVPDTGMPIQPLTEENSRSAKFNGLLPGQPTLVSAQ